MLTLGQGKGLNSPTGIGQGPARAQNILTSCPLFVLKIKVWGGVVFSGRKLK